MRTGPTLRLLVATAAIAVLFVTARPAIAEPPPLFEGRIVGGYFAMGPSGTTCGGDVDCIAWRVSGCNPALARYKHTLHSAVVPVARLAGSPEERRWRAVNPGTAIHWAPFFEFFSRGCEPIGDPIEVNSHYTQPRRALLQIPAGARWMTISTIDAANVKWDLR